MQLKTFKSVFSNLSRQRFAKRFIDGRKSSNKPEQGRRTKGPEDVSRWSGPGTEDVAMAVQVRF